MGSNKRLKEIKRNNEVVGHTYLCEENDNEIKYHSDDGEFLFGHVTGSGGHVVIGKQDLVNALVALCFDTE